MRYEALRLLCFFDLPMESKDEKRIYRNFRKELISNEQSACWKCETFGGY